MYKYFSDTEIYFSLKNTVQHWELTVFEDESLIFIILFVMYVTNSHCSCWSLVKQTVFEKFSLPKSSSYVWKTGWISNKHTGFQLFLLTLKDGERRKEKTQVYFYHNFDTIQRN